MCFYVYNQNLEKKKFLHSSNFTRNLSVKNFKKFGFSITRVFSNKYFKSNIFKNSFSKCIVSFEMYSSPSLLLRHAKRGLHPTVYEYFRQHERCQCLFSAAIPRHNSIKLSREVKWFAKDP